MSYSEIVRRSFAIVWRRPYLWLLGLLAAEGAGTPSIGQYTVNGRGAGGTGGAQEWNDFTTWFAASWGWVALGALLLVALIAALFLLTSVATGAIVRAAAEHDDDRPFGLGPAWRAGTATIWRVAGIRLLFGAAVVGSIVVAGGLIGATVVLAAGGMAGPAVAVGTLSVLVLLAALAFWTGAGVACSLTVRAIVLDGEAMLPALDTAVGLIRRHFGPVALVWLIILALQMVIGLGMVVSVVAVLIPLALIVLAGYAAGGTVGLVAGGILAGLLFVAGLLIVSGAVGAYTSTYWTLAYRRLSALTPTPLVAPAPRPA